MINKEIIDNDKNSISYHDYLNLIRNNVYPVIIITTVSFLTAIVFALSASNIYKATTTIKVSKPKGNVLETSLMPDIQDFTNDRFITTEIEILKSKTLRLQIAKAFLDSVKKYGNPVGYDVLKKNIIGKGNLKKLLLPEEIADKLKDAEIVQRRGMDIIEISIESPSPAASEMLVNIYANEYKLYNLEMSRNQLSNVQDFLLNQVKEKQQLLKESEAGLTDFQAQEGIISLDDQAKSLITELSSVEAKRDEIKVDLAASEMMLDQLKTEMNNQDPKTTAYLENLANESYFKTLQEQIAKLQVNKDLVVSNKSTTPDPAVIKQYDGQIADLTAKLNEKTKVIKQGLFASNPVSINNLSSAIIDATVKIKGLQSQQTQLNIIIGKYEAQFNKLPATSIKYAQLARKREASEKLFSMLEEKYQEAVINVQSEPGNVMIIDRADRPENPSKPNRPLIIIAGLFIGFGLSVIYLIIRNALDTHIKSPDELEKRGISILAWVPVLENSNSQDFTIHRKPDAVFSESFKALRTRVMFSRPDTENLKKILVTSAVPQEGKTTVSLNLAGAFAQDGKKTLLIDADLRKPRIHNIFGQVKTPGLIEYLFDQVSLEEITRPTPMENLSYITCGTIPHNPSELMGSNKMKNFVELIGSMYDVVIFDSAPVIAVTDSEILSRLVDATILVISADSTEVPLLEKAIQLIKNDSASFIGTVLNRFTYRAGYGSYYKYYYYYNERNKSKSEA